MNPSEYVILYLKIEQKGQIVRFSHRLPAHLKVCTGIKASPMLLYGKDDRYKETTGHLAVEFNDKRYLSNFPVWYSFGGKSNQSFTPLLLTLDTPNLTGYYRDTMLYFSPYDLVLYFQCKTELK